MEVQFLDALLKSLNKADGGVVYLLLVLITIYFIVAKYDYASKRFMSCACGGNPNKCKANIIRKCMQEYSIRETVVKCNANESYALDLLTAIKNGAISISDKDFNYRVYRHRKILSSAFLNGKYYIHDMVDVDDFPPTFIKVNGVDTLNPSFESLSDKYFDAYYGIVWDVYSETYNSDYYMLDFNERKRDYLNNKPEMQANFLDMMKQFNKTMGKER